MTSSELQSPHFQPTMTNLEPDDLYFPQFFRKYFHTSIPMAALYVLVVLVMKKAMVNRQKFELRGFLALWSGGLAVFSLFMFIGILKSLVIVWTNHGFHHSICEKWFFDYPDSRFWAASFMFSKIIEFGDTIFIVLRKQHLSFLHVFHHASALLLCWYTGGHGVSVVCYFAFVNTFVHVIMYTYFSLKALKVKVPKSISVAITTSQMIQMIFGVGIASYVFKLYQAGECNSMDFSSFMALSGAYVSFFLLFANFFYQNYVKNHVFSMYLKVNKNK